MNPFKALQRVQRYLDAFLSQRSGGEPLFEKLNDTNDTSVDDIDQDKNDDDGKGKNGLHWTLPEQRRRGCWRLSAVLVTTIVLWRKRSLLVAETAATEGPYHCGNSTSEARALGCEFDMLSYSWTPEACYERRTAQEFRAWLSSENRHLGAFPFFFDKDALEHVPDELTLSESHGLTIHTTQEEHLGHCTFLMRRWHRLATQHSSSHRFNHRFGKYHHTRHSTERILNGLMNSDVLKEEVLNSRFGITFEKC